MIGITDYRFMVVLFNLSQPAERKKLSVQNRGFLLNWQGQQASLFGISEMAERKLNQLASGGRALTFASGYRWRMASNGLWNRRSLKETEERIEEWEREQAWLIQFAQESDYNPPSFSAC